MLSFLQTNEDALIRCLYLLLSNYLIYYTLISELVFIIAERIVAAKSINKFRSVLLSRLTVNPALHSCPASELAFEFASCHSSDPNCRVFHLLSCSM